MAGDRISRIAPAGALATALAALAFGAAVAFLISPAFRQKQTDCEFDARIASSSAGYVQLYYDLGQGFNERDSRIQVVRAGMVTTSVRLPLPAGRYRALRFDPLNGSGTISVEDAVIRDASGGVFLRFPPSAFSATHQIKQLSARGDTLVIETTDGADDPNTRIALERPFDLADTGHPGWGFAAYGLAAASLAWAGLCLLNRLGPTLLEYLRRRPKRVLAAVSLAALAASNLPVAFLGRSFVSPNNGVLLLYDHIPTLPGYDSTTVARTMGSDVGAVMWWHLPAAIVEHRALFHDHELPLWNRYNLCGQTLLGQGQSMIGDPLHLLTAVLFNGSALAWDVKCLAAKGLFALGAGLCVLALTGDLAIASLLCASSLFIGFFSFRLNHPAIFSLCYSPWILYAWVRIARSAGFRELALGSAALVAADWMEISSGTVKEAYMLALGMNAAGALLLLMSRQPGPSRLARALSALWASLLVAALSAPLWLTFLDALHASATSYDRADVRQIPAFRLIGFFEDLFYRQSSPLEAQVASSGNFLLLLGVLWVAARPRMLVRERPLAALCVAALVPALLVFGGIPRSLIVRIPFLGNIVHVDDTFGCVLIPLLIPIAAYGLKACAQELRSPSWIGGFVRVLVLFAGLLGLYLAGDRHEPASGFFRIYAATLALALIVLPVAVHRAARSPFARPAPVLIAAACLLALHWRHAQYLASQFEGYVACPQVRADLTAPSEAVDLVKAQSAVRGPSRVVGLGRNLFPGVSAYYLVEGIYGVDALRSRSFQELACAFGLNRMLNFVSAQTDEGSARTAAAFNMMNVGFLVGSGGPSEGRRRGWSPVGSADLEVLRNTQAWPRAFFVDRLGRYSSLSELTGRIEGAEATPLACVDETDFPQGLDDARPVLPSKRIVVPASEYGLTTNATSFDVAAPGPGYAVLSETWLKDDFRVTVNGRPSDYIRVNHAFKAVRLDAAGRYRISFEYWPRRLTTALWLCAGAAVSAAISLFAGLRAPKRLPTGQGL